MAKDALLTIDDFAPAGTNNEVQAFHAKAERLLRGQGNLAGKARLWADGTLRKEYYPRGLILASGEDIPKGQSLRGRMFILEIPPGNVNLDILTRMQEMAAAGLLAQAMSAYLQWLAPRLDSLQTELPGLHQEYRGKARASLPHVHDRTPEIVASLKVGLMVFQRFAVEAGVLTMEEGAAFLNAGWKQLVNQGNAQSQHQASEDVVSKFLRLLQSAISSGSAHLAHPKENGAPVDAAKWGWRQKSGPSEEEFHPMGDRIGWVKAPYVYLDPEAAYAAVQKLARSQGSSIPIAQNTLWKCLSQKHILAEVEVGRNTVKKVVGGHQQRVISLHQQVLGIEATPEDPLEDIDFGPMSAIVDRNTEEVEKPVHH